MVDLHIINGKYIVSVVNLWYLEYDIIMGQIEDSG